MDEYKPSWARDDDDMKTTRRPRKDKEKPAPKPRPVVKVARSFATVHRSRTR
jgi:hypothetical protein